MNPFSYVFLFFCFFYQFCSLVLEIPFIFNRAKSCLIKEEKTKEHNEREKLHSPFLMGVQFTLFFRSLDLNNRQWWKESQEAKNAADCIFRSHHFILLTELTTLYALHLFLTSFLLAKWNHTLTYNMTCKVMVVKLIKSCKQKNVFARTTRKQHYCIYSVL